MDSTTFRAVFAGSATPMPPDYQKLAQRPDPAKPLRVTVLLHYRKPLPTTIDRTAPMSRAEFAREHGAADADRAAVAQFATSYGLASESGADPCSMVLSGTLAQFESAFNVILDQYSTPSQNTQFVAPDRDYSVPFSVRGSIRMVLGLSTCPIVSPA